MTEEKIDDHVLSAMRSQMRDLKIASAQDKVYKDECMFSFDTPYTSTGLYVDLKTYFGFGSEYLDRMAQHSHSILFLHQQWEQIPVKNDPVDSNEKTPTVLGIGVDGGFVGEKKFDLVKTHRLIVRCLNPSDSSTTDCSILLPNANIPEFITNVCDSIIRHDGMKLRMQATTAWTDSDEPIVESKYSSNLIQLSNGKKISNDPSTWACEESGRTDNLWLNLSTGYIGGGRKNWDGSGGSGAALSHYEATGKIYPLCVKLGTITASGADVYSYAADEDCMVKDPLLSEHLAWWGIDAMRCEKTDKTVAEMELSLNQTYDWTRILENDTELVSCAGAGLKGLVNMGSTCYMNSVVQVLLNCVPEMRTRYLETHQELVRQWCASSSGGSGANPCDNFILQMSKLACGILTGQYVPPSDTSDSDEGFEREEFRLTPLVFKTLVGKNHREFSGGRQQDASEYFQHLMEFMKRSERTALPTLNEAIERSGGNVLDTERDKSTAAVFDFLLERKYVCSATQQVRYICNAGTCFNVMEVNIPTQYAVEETVPAAAVATEGDAVKKPRLEDAPPIPFSVLLESYFEPAVVSMTNPSLGGPSEMLQTTRMASFPRYLMVKLGRYYVDNQWRQKKIDAPVDVPQVLDLNRFRVIGNGGIQAGEVPMPEESSPARTDQSATNDVDEAALSQLVSLGFHENGCRRALMATASLGLTPEASVEAAMNWVLEHMGDADFAEPIPAAGASNAAATSQSGAEAAADPEQLMLLSSMGFTEEQAKAALVATNRDVERAADWLFSHADDIDGAVAAVWSDQSTGASSGGEGSPEQLLFDRGFSDSGDGGGTYDLVAIISHIGKNTEHGHYVCHIKKGDKWVLFNDDKVAESVAPPLQLAYMYLFKRR